MIIVKVLAVYFVIKILSVLRQVFLDHVFNITTSTESDLNFELAFAILFAALIIREGLW